MRFVPLFFAAVLLAACGAGQDTPDDGAANVFQAGFFAEAAFGLDGQYPLVTMDDLEFLSRSVWYHFGDPAATPADSRAALMYRFGQPNTITVTYDNLVTDSPNWVEYEGTYEFLGNGTFCATLPKGGKFAAQEAPEVFITFKIEWASASKDTAFFTLLSCEGEDRPVGFARFVDKALLLRAF